MKITKKNYKKQLEIHIEYYLYKQREYRNKTETKNMTKEDKQKLKKYQKNYHDAKLTDYKINLRKK